MTRRRHISSVRNLLFASVTTSILALAASAANAQITTTGSATFVDNPAIGGDTTIDSFVGIATGGGGGGPGTLTVEGGSTLTIGIVDNSSGMNIGGSSSGTPGQGVATVTGAGSTIDINTIDSFLQVGRRNVASTATLNILNGGTVNTRLVQIGRDASTGTVLVDGTDSLLNLFGVSSGGFTGGGIIGRAGTEPGGQGTLTVQNGGEVRVSGAGGTGSNGGFTLGRDAATTGTINVQSGGDLNITGSEITGGGGITIGDFGAGTVNVNNATLAITGTTGPGMAIGRQTGSNGALNVTNGGSLTLTATQENNGFGFSVGGSGSSVTGGTGSVLVDGATSSLSVIGSDAGYTIGRRTGGNATMTVSNGGTVNSDSLVLGRETGSVGTMTVASGGIVNLTGDAEGDSGGGMAIGAAGVGTLTVSNGSINIDQGTAVRSSITVGGSITLGGGGVGTLNVTGAGSDITMTGSENKLRLGFDGVGNDATTGTVNVTDGGTISLDTTGRASIGAEAGSTGTATVTGAGSKLDAGAFLGIARDTDDNAAGTGTLIVSNGGTVEADLISIGSGGILTGSGGTVIGDVVVFDGGIVAPGSSPGDLVIQGGLDLRGGGILQIELGDVGFGDFDRLFIQGSIQVDDTTSIVFSFIDNEADNPNALDGLDLESFFFELDDTFDPDVDDPVANSDPFAGLPELLADTELTIESENFNGTVTIGQDGELQSSIAVPEPNILILFSSGLLALGAIRRRRRNGFG